MDNHTNKRKDHVTANNHPFNLFMTQRQSQYKNGHAIVVNHTIDMIMSRRQTETNTQSTHMITSWRTITQSTQLITSKGQSHNQKHTIGHIMVGNQTLNMLMSQWQSHIKKNKCSCHGG